MDKKELNFEDIMKEFGAAPIEETAERPAEEPASEEQSSLEVQQTEEETEEIDDVIIPDWLNEKKPKQTPVDMEATRRMEPVASASPVADLSATRRIEPVGAATPDGELTADTIRLDNIQEKLGAEPQTEPSLEDTRVDRIWNPGDTIHSEPFSKNWEPDYEQPIGEYVPPQPIQFQPRSRFRELKRQLIAGPEKRYYELSEQGFGRLQAAIFLSFLVVLICAASTVMYATGMVHENRMRLMVFGQFLAMLISALLGSFQLIEGVTDLLKKRFTLNTLLAVTFLVCCVDGVLCLKQVRVPCCAAFSLEVTMSLWSAYQRRSIGILQMDTMRKATRLDGIAACPNYMDGKKGFLRVEGQVDDFMDHYAEIGRPEKRLNTYSLVSMCIAFAIGIFAGVTRGIISGVQVTAVSLLAALPATAFICHSRPAILLERRLHRLGTVLCGWQGIEGLCGKAVFPLTFGDLYPSDAVRLNGVKFFGNRWPEEVVAYACAVITADNGGLTGLFNHLLDSHNGKHYDAYDLVHYDNGGVCATVEGELVLIGSASFLKDMDVEVPEDARLSYAVYVAIEGELCGLFAVSYEKTTSAAAGFSTLNAYRGLQCALVSDDFMLTYGFLRSKFGINPKRFLLPNNEVRQQLRQAELGEDAPTLLMTTALGLAPVAFAVTGARVLRTSSRIGTVLHIVGGAIGLAIMVLLVVLGALDLLTPANLFLYQLVWMIPAILFTEWTRSI